MATEKSVDDIQKLLKRAEDAKKKADNELAAAIKQLGQAKERDFLAAVGAAGEDVRLVVDKYLEHRKRSSEISENIKKQMTELESVKSYLVTQYPIIKDTLVGLKDLKESDLVEFIGESPVPVKVKKESSGTASTTTKKHVNLYDPQNVRHKWVDFGLTQGLTELELKGGEKGGVNARLVVMKKLDGKLPAGWKIVEE